MASVEEVLEKLEARARPDQLEGMVRYGMAVDKRLGVAVPDMRKIAKESGRKVEVIGCLPKNSPAMYDSIKAGQIVDSPMLPTLSDATAGGIEADSITFEPCRRYVDEWILVGEDEIREGIKLIFEEHRYVIEGAAGVVVASFLKLRDRLTGKNVVLVICGGNIEVATFREAVC